MSPKHVLFQKYVHTPDGVILPVVLPHSHHIAFFSVQNTREDGALREHRMTNFTRAPIPLASARGPGLSIADVIGLVRGIIEEKLPLFLLVIKAPNFSAPLWSDGGP